MLRLIHISDLHFGPFYVPAVGEALLGAVDRLDADVVVASGDFTQRATVEEYEQAAAFVDRLPCERVIVTPGNHDVPLYRWWERLTAPHRNYQRHIHKRLNHTTTVGEATIVSLDSTAPHRAIVNGRLDDWQLDYADKAFAAEPSSRLRIVVAHHHFAPAPDYERSPTLPNAKQALDRFQRAGVELVLGGHLHRAYVGNSLDVYAGANREEGMVIAQCGTTTSRRGRAREREKNSFNLIAVTERDITVTHWMYFSAEETFAPTSRHTFARWATPRLQPQQDAERDAERHAAKV
ncbi:cyclic 3',5'-adenosine monophosphate phosphodiesterase [Pseudobythopirellula maris]|uniref:Cyclic 3',5'-adenosine monophosphate phosphodiesterase n=1 Tax=Pseudobythopirellula maris TaxID=2527991 RepID=A0A5C5ZPM0_9BACT|nr:metallophosphoesterase family protein [Pseudobythopirellula maris]TWT89065.1 cyclic 3',5'-adenosine monophosphate phosphodiesterase [Pseudobythopirellula maris]